MQRNASRAPRYGEEEQLTMPTRRGAPRSNTRRSTAQPIESIPAIPSLFSLYRASAAVIVLLGVSLFYYLLPSALDPVPWLNPTPLLALEGPLAVTARSAVGDTQPTLSHAFRVEGDFSGPESIDFDPITGDAYVGFSDGTVGRFNSDGTLLERVFFSGGFVANTRKAPRSTASTTSLSRTSGFNRDSDTCSSSSSSVSKDRSSSCSGCDCSENDNPKQDPRHQPQGGVGLNVERLLLWKWCNDEAMAGRLAWYEPAERKCGRPLGVRFRRERLVQNKAAELDSAVLNPNRIRRRKEKPTDAPGEESTRYLYILDAYHGLFKLDLDAAVAVHLVTPSTPIHTPGGAVAPSLAAPADLTGKSSSDDSKRHHHSHHRRHRRYPEAVFAPPRFFNDLDVEVGDGSYGSGCDGGGCGGGAGREREGGECGGGGRVVFTDSSYKLTRSENRQELLDAAPRGRLLVFDQRRGRLSVVLCGMHFPNGVQILHPNRNPNRQQLQHQRLKQQREEISERDTETSRTKSVSATNNDDDDDDGGCDGGGGGCLEVIVNELTRSRALKVNIDAPFLKELDDHELPSSFYPLQSCEEFGSLERMLINASMLLPTVGDVTAVATAAAAITTATTATTDETIITERELRLYRDHRSHSRDLAYLRTGVTYFAEVLPGLPDNVRVDYNVAEEEEEKEAAAAANGNAGAPYYLFGLGSKSAEPFSLLHWAYQYVWPRVLIGKLLPMQLVEKLVPLYGLVVITDETGKLVDSLHDPTGHTARLISQASRNPTTGDLWLGSHSEALLILPAKHVPKRWGRVYT